MNTTIGVLLTAKAQPTVELLSFSAREADLVVATPRVHIQQLPRREYEKFMLRTMTNWTFQ